MIDPARDPFIITGPTVVANSGGKTSGFSLWKHLEANGGRLPDCARAVFTNTGWEHPATLDFLAEQERRWECEVVWLEFRWRKATAAEVADLKAKADRAADRLERFRREPASFFAPRRRATATSLFDNGLTAEQRKAAAVEKATRHADGTRASWKKAEVVGVRSYRKTDRGGATTGGGPFEELLEGLLRFRNEVKGLPGVLPNGVQRICTGELKVRVMHSFARDTWGVGRGDYEARLGLRADEPDRLKNAEEWGNEAGRAVFPLDEADMTKEDVAAFWETQPFKLSLKSHEGNCGGCYMKRREALVDLIRREFFNVGWWKGWEERTGQTFRANRTYRGLEVAARTELSLLPPDDYDNAITCEGGYCTD